MGYGSCSTRAADYPSRLDISPALRDELAIKRVSTRMLPKRTRRPSLVKAEPVFSGLFSGSR